MENQLKCCISYSSDTCNKNPDLLTTFSPNLDDKFVTAKKDINNYNLFTETKINHFIEYLNYLNKNNYHLHNCKSIYIVYSTFDISNTFVQINNTEIINEKNENTSDTNKKQEDNPETKKYFFLYINYNPEFFVDSNNNSSTSEETNITQITPLISVTQETKVNESMRNTIFNKSKRSTKFNIDLGIKYPKNMITKIFTGVTFLNCMLYCVLYSIYKNSKFTKDLIETPFCTLFDIIVPGIIYSAIGTAISSLGKWHSGTIIVNSLMFWNNFNIFKLISAKY